VKIPDGYILLINRKRKVTFTQSLYGLKQSPRAWVALDTPSQINEFKPTESERCIYVGRWKKPLYILVYVVVQRQTGLLEM
jgi:hypothetical protein